MEVLSQKNKWKKYWRRKLNEPQDPIIIVGYTALYIITSRKRIFYSKLKGPHFTYSTGYVGPFAGIRSWVKTRSYVYGRSHTNATFAEYLVLSSSANYKSQSTHYNHWLNIYINMCVCVCVCIQTSPTT